jgi:hypothetical protein
MQKEHCIWEKKPPLFEKEIMLLKFLFNMQNQRQLIDSDILKLINDLRFAEDWISLIVCVGLAVGSRLIEILRVTTYQPVENPIYIRVEGVAKDKK